MNFFDIKKAIIIRIAILSTLAIASCSVAFYFYSQISSLKEQKIKLEQENKKITMDIAVIQSKAKESKELLEKWNTRKNKTEVSSDGVSITNAQLTLNEMRDYYEFTNFAVEVSKPVDSDTTGNSKEIKISSSGVTISFSSWNDILVFSFLDALNNLDGYVAIKSLEIEKKQDIDDMIIQNVDKGDIPELVSASISFSWKNFRKIEATQTDESTTNNNELVR